MKALLKRLLSAETESEVLEFKTAKTQHDKDKLGRYFSALSNEANLSGLNSAYILFGIDNRKHVVGTEVSDKLLNEFKIEIANHTSPTMSFSKVERIQVANRNVIVFEIPAAPQGMPVSWKDHYYARNGESLSGLSIDKIERIRHQPPGDWSKEIIKDASIEDLDPAAIKAAREYFKEKNPGLKKDIPKWDDITFLNKAKITIGGKITRAAVLLLGKPESDHYLNPATSKITWILRDRDGVERDYEHFFCPLLLEVQNVYSKIRNLKYRYLQEGSIFPEEVNQFEPYIIREALNNCIAHQDYRLGGKINLVEREDGVLTFSNAGSFIPKSIENVISADAPEELYRNPFLSNAMVSFNMIDTIGSGIKKMFMIQKSKYFPLPEYDFSHNKVVVSITGKVIDVNYARKLALMPNLTLNEIILLDKVQKRKSLTSSEIKALRSSDLIEGRKPNFFISSTVADITGQQSDYIKLRGIEDAFLIKLIKEYLVSFRHAKRSDLNSFLSSKLPEILTDAQRDHKVKNLLQKMRKSGIIELDQDRFWKLK